MCTNRTLDINWKSMFEDEIEIILCDSWNFAPLTFVVEFRAFFDVFEILFSCQLIHSSVFLCIDEHLLVPSWIIQIMTLNNNWKTRIYMIVFILQLIIISQLNRYLILTNLWKQFRYQRKQFRKQKQTKRYSIVNWAIL